jgi:hypothetical protein
MTNIQLTQELVKYLFDYTDGFLYVKNKSSKMSTAKIGSKAGYLRTINSGNRIIIKVYGKDYLSARLIFFWHHGCWPEIVDHKNLNYNDDRIDNLRATNKSGNNKNTSSRKGSTSKYLGVCWLAKMWQANIWVNNKTIKIGRFKDEHLAALAYNREAVRYHKEFANLNIVTL